MTQSPAISPTFREGHLIDRWIVVHFLSGAAGALSNVFFGLSNAQVFGLGFSLMLIWEIGEHTQGIRESLANRVVDVLAGLAGVALGLWMESILAERWERIAFWTVLVLALVDLAFGVRAYRRRVAAKRRR